MTFLSINLDLTLVAHLKHSLTHEATADVVSISAERCEKKHRKKLLLMLHDKFLSYTSKEGSEVPFSAIDKATLSTTTTVGKENSFLDNYH
mgnify:CR=1 FL=1